jgi:hypothetical protein
MNLKMKRRENMNNNIMPMNLKKKKKNKLILFGIYHLDWEKKKKKLKRHICLKMK